MLNGDCIFFDLVEFGIISFFIRYIVLRLGISLFDCSSGGYYDIS